jgi:hypothetical protein
MFSFALLQGISEQYCHLILFCFAGPCWAPWHIADKLTIELIILRQQSVFEMPLVNMRDIAPLGR